MGELVRLAWPLHAQHMCQRLWHLLREDFSTDFELSIKDKEEDCVDQPSIRVHRLIISAVCPLFKQYLGDKILFSNRPHVDFQEVNSLVEFIYRGKTTVPQERLPHLRHVANSLGLTVLVEIIDGLLGSSAEGDTTSTAKETEQSSSNSMVKDLDDVPKEDRSISKSADNMKQKYTSRNEKCSVGVSMMRVTSDERRKKDFWCQPCSRGFEQKKDLVRHLASIHHVDRQGNKLEKNIKCPKCAFTCYAMFQLGKHRRAKHRDRSTLLKCYKCHFLCSDDDLLSRHLEMFHAHDGIFKCFKCEHVSQTPAEHVEHVEQHDDNRSSRDLDEAVSNNESSLIHNEVINLSKDSKCDDVKAEEEHSISEIIPNVSQQTTSKTKHYSKTDGKRLYVSIKRKSGKYVCQHCPRWSNNHQDLVRHLAAVHHIDKEGNKLEKAIKCSECSYACYAMFQLNKHHRMKHTLSHMFKCDKCDFVFGSEVQLSRHMEAFHAHNGYLNYEHVSNIRDELGEHVQQHNDNRSDCDLEEMASNDESSFGHETVMVLADDSTFDGEHEDD